MRLHFYESSSGRNLIYDYIDDLPIDEQVDGYSVLEHLEKDELDQVQFKQWERKVYEVYFYRYNRIFYVTVDGTDMYLLHACKKQKNKTEMKDKKIVEKRAKELGKMLGKKII